MSRLAQRRKQEDINVGHERWLVSYADFITLLFGFFVVMYSVSQVSETKYRALSETLSSAFSANANQDISSNSATPEQNQVVTEEPSLAELESLSEQIENTLAGFSSAGDMRLAANENWIELTVSSELLFETGRAEPLGEAREVFSELADMLSAYDNEVQVVGHTDDVPIANERFANNWDLSSARAIEIVNLLAVQGVKPGQLSAVAFGEHRPIADNSTEEGRRKNRRVVLRISDKSGLPGPLETGGADSDAAAEGSENNVSDTAQNANITAQQPDGAQLLVNTQTDNRVDIEASAAVKPVRLKGGDLLFTSDPDLPRLREIELAPEQENSGE